MRLRFDEKADIRRNDALNDIVLPMKTKTITPSVVLTSPAAIARGFTLANFPDSD
jgi:hypothetical protein